MFVNALALWWLGTAIYNAWQPHPTWRHSSLVIYRIVLIAAFLFMLCRLVAMAADKMDISSQLNLKWNNHGK